MSDETIPQTHRQRRLASMRPWYQIWWSAITRPNKTTYDEIVLEARVNPSRAFLWIPVSFALSSAIALETGQIIAIFGGRPGSIGYPAIQGLGFGSFVVTAILFVIQSMVVNTILFLIVAGLIHLVAHLLRGRGSFMTFLFVLAAAYLPITFIIQVIPFAAVAIFYGSILLVYATRSAYSISTGRSIAVSHVMGTILFALAIFISVSILHI